MLSPYTAFLCRIKETASAKIDEATLIKLKNFMEGASTITGPEFQIFIKILIGATATFNVRANSTVEDLKEMISEEEGIVPD